MKFWERVHCWHGYGLVKEANASDSKAWKGLTLVRVWMCRKGWPSTERVSVKSSHYSFFLPRMTLFPCRVPTNIRWPSPSLVAIQHCVSRLLVHLHLRTQLTESRFTSLVSVFTVFSPSQVPRTQLYRLQQLGLQANMMAPSFVCGSMDPNSDSHDCMASTYQASRHPSLWLEFFKIMIFVSNLWRVANHIRRRALIQGFTTVLIF